RRAHPGGRRVRRRAAALREVGPRRARAHPEPQPGGGAARGRARRRVVGSRRQEDSESGSISEIVAKEPDPVHERHLHPVGLRHLKGLPFVDGDRVVLMGWSHGGWTTLEAIASRPYRSSPDQFRAAIAFYPWCRDALTEPFRVPILVLIGGSDDWTPAKKCEDMQARLGPVNPDAPPLRVQVYQGAHHDFDDVAASNCCGHTLQ